MKKRNWKMILSISILAIIICSILILVSYIVIKDKKYGLRHYFDDWESEISENAIAVVWRGKLIVGGDEVPIKCVVNDSLYADENRIYFIKSSYINSPLKKEKWSIVSMDHNGNDYKIHYEDEFTDYYYCYPGINQKEYDNGICVGKKIY